MGLLSSLNNTSGAAGTGVNQVPPYVASANAYGTSGNLSDTSLLGGSTLGISANENTGSQQSLVNNSLLNSYSNYTTQSLAQQQQAEVQPTGGASISPLSSVQQGVGLANQASGGSLLGGVTNSINSFGNTALGFGLPASAGTGAASVSAFGQTAADIGSNSVSFGAGADGAAASWTGATLSGTLGAAGLGYAGGSLLAGWLGENQTGGGIGGALGAGIGMAAFGPLGALAGGVLGSVVGGLFGNSQPSDETQVGGVILTNGQTTSAQDKSNTGSEYSASNNSLMSSAQTGASNLVNYLIQNGATPNQSTQNLGNDPTVNITVGGRDGYRIGTSSSNNAYQTTTTLPSGSDPASLYSALSQQILGQYNIPTSLQTQLSQTDLQGFYSPNYNSQNMNATGTSSNPVFNTPTVAPQNNNGIGILQVPVNNPTGQTNTAAATPAPQQNVQTTPTQQQPLPAGDIT